MTRDRATLEEVVDPIARYHDDLAKGPPRLHRMHPWERAAHVRELTAVLEDIRETNHIRKLMENKG